MCLEEGSTFGTRAGKVCGEGEMGGWGVGGTALPSAVPDKPSALKLLVLFFRRCFLRLACGEGGGSILGLVVLEILGLEQTESPRPVSERREKRLWVIRPLTSPFLPFPKDNVDARETS